MSLTERKLDVSNFIWSGAGRFDPGLASDLDEAERALRDLSGQFAIDLGEGSRRLLARDPLGVNKLFFAMERGHLASSNYLVELRRQGFGMDAIYSVASGCAVLADPERGIIHQVRHTAIPFNDAAGGTGALESYLPPIRSALHGAFRRVAEAGANRRVFVTMSGGADSTVVALLAKDYLPHVEAVTFTLADSRGESEDAAFARRAARDLGIPLTVVAATREEILELVDFALIWGQDWRDFNVHCALVNAALGRALIRAIPKGDPRPLLLTGDTMNEMMVDYEPVRYKGEELYRLPRVGRAQLRRFMVTGLDSGDRELGVLTKMGFDVIQPLAMCAEAYLGLPAAFLEQPAVKQEVARQALDGRIPPYVLSRPKVRAQAAGAADVGGTLGVLLDSGMDAKYLKRRWSELFGTPEKKLIGVIRAGMYKCPGEQAMRRPA